MVPSPRRRLGWKEVIERQRQLLKQLEDNVNQGSKLNHENQSRRRLGSDSEPAFVRRPVGAP
jgi:hypothetical protein